MHHMTIDLQQITSCFAVLTSSVYPRNTWLSAFVLRPSFNCWYFLQNAIQIFALFLLQVPASFSFPKIFTHDLQFSPSFCSTVLSSNPFSTETTCKSHVAQPSLSIYPSLSFAFYLSFFISVYLFLSIFSFLSVSLANNNYPSFCWSFF